MRRAFHLFYFFVVIFVLVQAGFYLYHAYLSKTPVTPNSPLSLFKKEKAPTVEFMTQAKGDVQGSTVTYTIKGQEGPRAHTSAGLVYASDNHDLLRYVVGAFNSWEKIPGSLDRYMILYDPTTGAYLPKVRVLFSPSPYIEAKNQTDRITLLKVLDLNKASLPVTESTAVYKYVNEVEEKELNRIIKPGDVLTVFPYFETAESIILDENKAILAATTYLRRFGGVVGL